MAWKSEYRERVLDREIDELFIGLPAIALEGAKGVGKTATALQRAASVHRLDDPAQRDVAGAGLDRLLETEPPVLIDEWQFIPATWDRVRRAVDAGAPPGSFLLTGSSSPAGTGTHSGAGRIVSLRMRPLSLAERFPDVATVSLRAMIAGEIPAVEGVTEVGLADYTSEIVGSGFPGLRGLKGVQLRAQLDSYIARVVDRDFPELGGRELRNPAALRRWMAAYAAATSTAASYEKILDAATAGAGAKPTRKSTQPFRDILQRLFILDPVPGWKPTRNHVAELGEAPKHQLADPALAAQLVGASVESLLDGKAPNQVVPRDGSFLGALFESLVTLSIRVYAQAAEARVGHMRTHRGEHEVDLIIERGDGRIVAMAVKLSETPDAASIRHLKWLKGRIGDDLLDAVVITTGKQAYRRPDGIAVVPAALLGP